MLILQTSVKKLHSFYAISLYRYLHLIDPCFFTNLLIIKSVQLCISFLPSLIPHSLPFRPPFNYSVIVEDKNIKKHFILYFQFPSIFSLPTSIYHHCFIHIPLFYCSRIVPFILSAILPSFHFSTFSSILPSFFLQLLVMMEDLYWFHCLNPEHSFVQAFCMALPHTFTTSLTLAYLLSVLVA